MQEFKSLSQSELMLLLTKRRKIPTATSVNSQVFSCYGKYSHFKRLITRILWLIKSILYLKYGEQIRYILKGCLLLQEQWGLGCRDYRVLFLIVLLANVVIPYTRGEFV